ncbi:DNA topoisomerase 1 [Puccinia graminis f. sp. tritici]|uniref:DNA topoisomerase 1 n=1 Tax=Puccinia graminis f. sp. tritici TaxID=56615 RepID=A0A5B0QS14_PUCGR|nr:DNA topoisomerase 1 [Puccinia graminis f. sp. tritici]
MAKLVTNTNARPATKRVISESSSEEDTPIAKRSKSDTKSTQQATLPTPNSEPSQDPPTSSALSSEDENEGEEATPKEEEEAGDDDDEDDDEEVDDSSDDDQPIANSNYKPTLTPKRSIDESSASTTLTTNTDRPITDVRKLPAIKKNSQPIKPKPDPDSSSDDDQPLVSRQPAPATVPVTTAKQRVSVKKEESESDDSKPLVSRAAAKPKPTKTTRASKRAAPKTTAKGKQPKRKKNANNDDEDEDEDGDAKDGPGGENRPDGETQQDAEAQQEEAMYRWWEENKDDDTKKWSTLQHNGVLFPPEYEPLPGHVKMKYNGKSVDLPPESEEVAFFYGSMLNSDHVKKAVFRENFFHDWLEVLKEHPPVSPT